MKKILIALTLASTLHWVSGQEHLPRVEALKYAFLVSADLKQLVETPLPTDVDLKRPAAMQDGQYGVLALPEAKLTPATLTAAGAQAVPVGQLWLHNLTPMRDGWAIPGNELRLASVNHDEGVAVVPQCALGARRNDAGQLELVIFGKAARPLLAVPLKPARTSQSDPIALGAERSYDGGRITLRILGQFEATFEVTELENI